VAFTTWRHLTPQTRFPWLYIYIFSGVFGGLLLLQCCCAIYCNYAWGKGFPEAFITLSKETVTIRVYLRPRPMNIKAGQNVNLWIPSVSFWSPLQTHPFVVTSWAEGSQDCLELFVQPRRGFTRKLFSLKERNVSRFALLTGPHGTSTPVSSYETVLMVANEFGIAAQLPFLTKLIHGHNTCKTRTRRIHLVWQMPSLGMLRD